ncbi:ribosome maturation factor RimM [Candidatus Latescibacterota bacterium]
MTKPTKAEPDNAKSTIYVAIGRVIGARGLKGEIKVKSISNVSGRFKSLDLVSLEFKNGNIVNYEVEYTKINGQAVIQKLVGIDNRDDAETLSGAFINVSLDNVAPLEDDSYYIFELEGMDVFDSEGKMIGSVKRVELLSANDLIYVENESEEIIIPAIKEFIIGIDTDTKKMTVDLPEGLPRYPKTNKKNE